VVHRGGVATVEMLVRQSRLIGGHEHTL
jgi:hypothetical protein